MARKWTEEEETYLRENYGKVPMEEMAEVLHRKRKTVVAYANKHGIYTGVFWTKEEEQYLLDKVGVLPVSSIARVLNKPYSSVCDKMKHMETGNFLENCEYITVTEASKILGVSDVSIKRIWAKYGLPVYKKGRYRMVDLDELLEFMQENTALWNPDRCDKEYFDIYPWFNEINEWYKKRNTDRRWNANMMGKKYKVVRKKQLLLNEIRLDFYATQVLEVVGIEDNGKWYKHGFITVFIDNSTADKFLEEVA